MGSALVLKSDISNDQHKTPGSDSRESLRFSVCPTKTLTALSEGPTIYLPVFSSAPS